MAEPNYMAYAQYMGARNPMAEGLNQLGTTIQDIQKQGMEREDRQRRNSLADLQLRQGAMSLQQGQLALDEAQRQATDRANLRNRLAGLQPTTSTVQVPNPMYGKPLDPGLAQAQADNDGEWTPSAVQVMRNAQGLGEAPQAEDQHPTIDKQVVTQPDPMKTIFDHAMKTGALDVAKQAIDMQTLIRNTAPDKLKADEALKELGSFTSALKHVKELKQAGVLSQGMLDGIYGMLPEGIKAKMPNGLTLKDITEDAGLEVKDAQGNVIAHWAVSPDGTKTELIKSSDKDKETWSEPYLDKVGGKVIKVQRSSTGRVQAVAQDSSTTVKVNTGSGGHLGIKMNGLSPEQTDALSTAIAEGRLAPYKINSKNQQILADTALKNPGINLNDIDANLGLARNKDVQMKSAIAETVPPLLKSIVDAGSKLNYSNNQFFGAAQQWLDKKSNNPQFVKYMTLRNDQLLTLGGIMRSNGMTDMAQRLEEEAAQPTMSPRALQGWLEGQLESVMPRLDMYRSIRAGKGAPRPNEGSSSYVTKGGFKVTVK